MIGRCKFQCVSSAVESQWVRPLREKKKVTWSYTERRQGQASVPGGTDREDSIDRPDTFPLEVRITRVPERGR